MTKNGLIKDLSHKVCLSRNASWSLIFIKIPRYWKLHWTQFNSLLQSSWERGLKLFFGPKFYIYSKCNQRLEYKLPINQNLSQDNVNLPRKWTLKACIHWFKWKFEKVNYLHAMNRRWYRERSIQISPYLGHKTAVAIVTCMKKICKLATILFGYRPTT